MKSSVRFSSRSSFTCFSRFGRLSSSGNFFNLFLNCLQAVEQHVAMCGITGAFELLEQARFRQAQRVESFFELSLFR